jgi:hypothetical protein
MSRYVSPDGWVVCGHCGKAIEDTPGANVDYQSRGCDAGIGICRECGGDPTAKSTRRKMGDNLTSFIDHRIPIVRDRLNEANRAKFEAMPYEQQAKVIIRMVERGLLI